MTILAELFSFERFDTAKMLMGYLGLTASEHTSGVVRRGDITRTGHQRVRTALTEAAQHSSKSVHLGPDPAFVLHQRRRALAAGRVPS